MRETRTAEERLIDNVLTLALLSHARDPGNVGDRLKVMKLLFLADYQMFSAQAKGLNFTFFRYDLGPFSKQVYGTWADLVETDHLGGELRFRLTDKGLALARAFEEEVLDRPENSFFRDVLRYVTGNFVGLSSNQVLRRVYDMPVRDVFGRHYERLELVPLHTNLTEILEPHEAKTTLQVEEGWLETLSIIFDATKTASLQTALEEARAGRLLTREQVWPAVS